MTTVRRASRADLDRFYGPGKFKHTVIAYVGRRNGRIVACGGLAFVNRQVHAFFDVSPAARKYPTLIVLASKMALDEARRIGIRVVYAQIDPDEPKAERWVRALGFRPTFNKNNLYRWMA